MTILADPAVSRARTTPPPPRIQQDAEGNDYIATPLGTITHVERDAFGEPIEGWPLLHFDPAGDPFDETSLAEHIRACQAMLAHVDPGGVNRLPRIPYGQTEPPATPADDEQASELHAHRTAATVAARLDHHQRRVLLLLAEHAAHLARTDDDGEHWVWDTDHGAAPFAEADDDAVATLAEAGLLNGHRTSDLGRQVAACLAGDGVLVGVA